MSLIKGITAYNENNATSGINIDIWPDKCPICHQGIHPTFIYACFNSSRWDKDNCLEIVLKCPRLGCDNLFISRYRAIRSNCDIFLYVDSLPVKKQAREFSEEIESISEKFSIIYNQALSAEQDGLKEICGAGYRRALEFLIKDYLIKKLKPEDKGETPEGLEKTNGSTEKITAGTEKTTENEEEKIKKKFLGNCISEDIKNEKIKKVAKRAAWLGNDETHYIRIWEDKDLEDLKTLIELTVRWIEMEELTEKVEEDMPEGEKKK